ncbi:hypothetical protein DFH08DRAFT_1016937 [Mycena albidolilacea]|uniref:Uncharacterized protein n=1 Tax=Mycena albidolilacea TaxID=1033008 RepID=A0AAD7F3K5_9AGAR|nr:hypothetical protein DFH08DRAFT_1016937 [Mycena albidolilacea]
MPLPLLSPLLLYPLPLPPPTRRRMPPTRRLLPGTDVSHNALLTPRTVYTFLATLILLGVSSAIVVRSLRLRRRHRRMVAEAIANGTWLPPAPRVKVDLRKKPRLWDTWVAPPLNAAPGPGGAGADGLLSPGANAQAHAGGGAKGDASGEKDKWDAIICVGLGLPHLEVGVASVGVVAAPDREGEGRGGGKGVPRDSEDRDGGGKAKVLQ